MAIIRPICRVPGCGNLAKMKGKDSKGRVTFRNVCSTHEKRRRTTTMKVGRCQLCGWQGKVHMHRKRRGEYEPLNVQVVCPNCHAASHGNGEFNQPQTYPEVKVSTVAELFGL